ncbi:MAG: hypothetical protein QGI68_01270 [Pseudomonadales bacterium]|jgi:hypothetical protein|nr:hypothetical protein [Pseudomonadales bacterium]MDP7360431.1 hypothetical protein [Pseudomonadales bacterium]MDP7594184.1 hypothetical protein [Pseudomonadales bacterium]HJN52889.1 hypothetical protein [Pseudomonadales bacterium]|tara:strand:+ start:2633 stop:3238 length:606 start_codon:yes stop_codon:yes gene_type:complete
MKKTAALLLTLILAACASQPPGEPDNICSIFAEKDKWYKKARKSYRRWGTPIPVLMAFTHQESGYKAKAKPPRKKILGFIPGRRPASAFGFAQAVDETWKQYKKATGRRGADRDDFEDAMDFVGWYNDQSHRKNGIAKSDARNLYYAYHEGHGGFKKGSYRSKKWLVDVAAKVASRAANYQTQLNRCEKKLQRNWFLWLFS